MNNRIPHIVGTTSRMVVDAPRAVINTEEDPGELVLEADMNELKVCLRNGQMLCKVNWSDVITLANIAIHAVTQKRLNNE